MKVRCREEGGIKGGEEKKITQITINRQSDLHLSLSYMCKHNKWRIFISFNPSLEVVYLIYSNCDSDLKHLYVPRFADLYRDEGSKESKISVIIKKIHSKTSFLSFYW